MKANNHKEDNFVVKTEYPLAKDSGKIIFPAEFRTTDKRLLAEKFPGLMSCVDAGLPMTKKLSVTRCGKGWSRLPGKSGRPHRNRNI